MTSTVQDLVGRACVNKACPFWCPVSHECLGDHDRLKRCECRNDESELPAKSVDKTQCGKCGSTSLTDLGHGKKGAVICHDCGAQWWERWRSKKDHEDYINVVDGVDLRKCHASNAPHDGRRPRRTVDGVVGQEE